MPRKKTPSISKGLGRFCKGSTKPLAIILAKILYQIFTYAVKIMDGQ
jgi:hypothetical protein